MDSSSHQNCQYLQFSEHLLQGKGERKAGGRTKGGGEGRGEEGGGEGRGRRREEEGRGGRREGRGEEGGGERRGRRREEERKEEGRREERREEGGGRRRGDEYKCSKCLTLVWSLSTSSAFAFSKKLVAIRTSAACSLLW